MTGNKITVGAIVRINLPNSPHTGHLGIARKIVCNGRGCMVRLKGGHESYFQTSNLVMTGEQAGPWEKWGEE
jgi:hypothetical protein